MGVPAAAELDDRAMLSGKVLDQMDLMLREMLRKKMNGYAPQGLGKGTNPNNRWRAVSCLQKAVRFRDFAMAKYVASAAYDMDAAYVMRRLGIIAVEDVGAGSLFGICAVLAAAGSVVWRREMGERLLMVCLAERLARSAKDRTACELCVIADFEKTLDKAAMGKWSDDQLAAWVLSDRPLVERMLAAWLLAGTKRYFGTTVPADNNRPPTRLFQLMVKQGLPRAMLYAAARTASRLSEGMFVSFLFMHEMLTATQTLTYAQPEMPPTPKVGVLLGAAYDMHTREGRTALRKFEKECKAVGHFRDLLVDRTYEEYLMGYGVFLAEGGVLQTRAVYAGSDELRQEAHVAELNFPGLPEAEHGPFLQAIRDNLPQLNQIREKVVYASQVNK
jgi:hypothetical protein